MVAMLYAVSQLPRHIMYLVTMSRPTAFEGTTMLYIWLACQLCTWSATCYNPFIYAWMNQEFRQSMYESFGNILCCCCPQLTKKWQTKSTRISDSATEYDRRLSDGQILKRVDTQQSLNLNCRMSTGFNWCNSSIENTIFAYYRLSTESRRFDNRYSVLEKLKNKL